jgi:hypothetical protein
LESEYVEEGVWRFLRSWGLARKSQVHYVDVGKDFLETAPDGQTEINEVMLPDCVDPSEQGMRIIMSALLPLIASILDPAT